jgi:hypothetical protein
MQRTLNSEQPRNQEPKKPRNPAARHLAHGQLGGEAKALVKLMRKLHPKLQKAGVENFGLAIVGQRLPGKVASLHGLLKSLQCITAKQSKMLLCSAHLRRITVCAAARCDFSCPLLDHSFLPGMRKQRTRLQT